MDMIDFDDDDDDFFGVDENDALAGLDMMAPSPAKPKSRYGDSKTLTAQQIIESARHNEKRRQEALLKAAGVDQSQAKPQSNTNRAASASPLITLPKETLIDLPALDDGAEVSNQPASPETIEYYDEDDDDEEDEVFFGAVSAKECQRRVETIKLQAAAAMSATDLQKKHELSAQQYEKTIAELSKEANIQLPTVAKEAPLKGILKKNSSVSDACETCSIDGDNDDDDDEVFIGAVSTKEVKKTLQVTRTEIKHAVARTAAQVSPRKAHVSVATTKSETNAALQKKETTKQEPKAVKSGIPQRSGIPRKSGLPQPKFKSGLARPKAKLSSFASPAREPIPRRTAAAKSALSQHSVIVSVSKAEEPTIDRSPSPLISLSPESSNGPLIILSSPSEAAPSPLISLSPCVSERLSEQTPLIDLTSGNTDTDKIVLENTIIPDSDVTSSTIEINPALLSALQKAKKPVKQKRRSLPKAPTTIAKVPACAALKPKNATSENKALFKASDDELKALENAIIDPSDRENFKINTLSDNQQLDVKLKMQTASRRSPDPLSPAPAKEVQDFGETKSNFCTEEKSDLHSAWSPVRKPASFEQVQAQYY